MLGIDNINDYYDPKLPLEKVDIADREALTQSFQSFNPDKVVNIAMQAGVHYSIENPYAYMDSNLVGFLNILELCRHNKVEGFVYVSSSLAHGCNTKNTFSEDGVNNPISLYLEYISSHG